MYTPLKARPMAWGVWPLGTVWLFGLATMGLLGALIDGADEDIGLIHLGGAAVVLGGPLFLSTFTLVARWPLIRDQRSALATVWALGGLGIGLAWVAGATRKPGPEITTLLLLSRLIALLGPYYLAGVTLVWLVDRPRRRPGREGLAR